MNKKKVKYIRTLLIFMKRMSDRLAELTLNHEIGILSIGMAVCISLKGSIFNF